MEDPALRSGRADRSLDDGHYRGHERGPAPRAQWVGLFLAPVTFFAHLQVGYVLVLWACTDGDPSGVLPAGRVALHVAGALSVALAALGVWAAWLAWVRAGATEPKDRGGPLERTRFLAATGLGVSAILTLLLLAQWAAVFVVPPCQ